MTKTFAVALLMTCVAMPAFADHDGYRHDHYNARHVHSETSTYTTQTTYRQVRVPLTPEQIAERQRLITKIEQDMRRFVDLNKDNVVDFDEYAAGEQRLHTDNMDIRTSFDATDTNKNGVLSSQEILEAQVAQREAAAAPVVVSRETQHVIYTKE